MIKLNPTILWIGCSPQNFIFTYFWTTNKSEHHYSVSSSEEKKQAHRFGDFSIFCHEYKIHLNEDWRKGDPEDLLCSKHCVRHLAWSKLLFAVLLSFFFFWNYNWKMSPVSPTIHIPHFFADQVAQDHVLHRHINSSILFIPKATQPEGPHILTSPCSPDKHLSLFFQSMVFTSFLLLTALAVHHLWASKAPDRTDLY